MALARQVPEAEHAAHGLGDGGGEGRRPHAPAKAAHEQQIEHHVRHGGDDEVDERALAVAQGVHDAGADVVEHHGERAQEVVAEVLDGLRQHLRVGVHPHEQRGRERHAQHGQNKAADEAHGEVRVYGAENALPVLRAEAVRDDDARAERRAVEEADEKEDERARGADCRQRIGAQELPHDDGVRRVVQLLEDLAEKYGHGELDDEQVGAALRHVLNGG